MFLAELSESLLGLLILIRLRQPLAGQYPRGHKELRGSFFRTHGPKDTIAWFSQRGVSLKVLRFRYVHFLFTSCHFSGVQQWLSEVCVCVCVCVCPDCCHDQKEEDGRMFPVSNSSSTIVDCLLNEARRIGGMPVV